MRRKVALYNRKEIRQASRNQLPPAKALMFQRLLQQVPMRAHPPEPRPGC